MDQYAKGLLKVLGTLVGLAGSQTIVVYIMPLTGRISYQLPTIREESVNEDTLKDLVLDYEFGPDVVYYGIGNGQFKTNYQITRAGLSKHYSPSKKTDLTSKVYPIDKTQSPNPIENLDN